jgi:uncharacterized RDD family membrane protein YckC
MTDTQQSGKEPAGWRLLLAAIFDIISTFVGFGFLVASFTGGLIEHGFSLSGWAALLWLALTVAYFIVFNKFLGGTIGKWIFSARRR